MSTQPPIKVDVPNTSGSEYGLSSDAAGATFDLSGLTGLGSGQVKGSDLLHAFIAAGNGQGDPTIAAAIQQALALAGYYTSATFTPHPGRVLPDDIKAFASALNVLADSNKATPSGSGMPQQTLAQFLSSAATTGVESGQYAAQTKVHQYQIATPDPAKVAAAFEAAAQKIWDRRPTPAETAQFVRQFSNQTVATEKQNATNDFNASTQPITVQGADTPAPLAPAGPNPGTVQHPGGPGQRGAMLGLGPGDVEPPTFQDQMQTLQDVINQNAQSAPADTMVTSDTQDVPDASVDAENFARNLHPKEAAANDLGNTMNNFLNLISTKLV